MKEQNIKVHSYNRTLWVKFKDCEFGLLYKAWHFAEMVNSEKAEYILDFETGEILYEAKDSYIADEVKTHMAEYGYRNN